MERTAALSNGSQNELRRNPILGTSVNKAVAHRTSQSARLLRVLRKARLGVPRRARVGGLPLAHAPHLQVPLGVLVLGRRERLP
jgi:hypothetical protein